MSLTYVGSRPAHFQYGDLVQARLTTAENAGPQPWGPTRDYAAGEVVEGVITRAVNHEAAMLDRGRVEIRTESGDRLWVQAERVLSTYAQREHPLRKVAEVRAYEWTCTCGQTGQAPTEQEARNDHTRHGERAHR